MTSICLRDDEKKEVCNIFDIKELVALLGREQKKPISEIMIEREMTPQSRVSGRKWKKLTNDEEHAFERSAWKERELSPTGLTGGDALKIVSANVKHCQA